MKLRVLKLQMTFCCQISSLAVLNYIYVELVSLLTHIHTYLTVSINLVVKCSKSWFISLSWGIQGRSNVLWTFILLSWSLFLMHNKFIGLYGTSNPENKQSPYSSILFPLKSKVGELHFFWECHGTWRWKKHKHFIQYHYDWKNCAC